MKKAKCFITILLIFTITLGNYGWVDADSESTVVNSIDEESYSTHQNPNPVGF